jgi:hypothetical protein
MSFQAYLDTIKKVTGKTPEEIHVIAKKKGILVANLKANNWVLWIQKEFKLGRGHAMALWGYFINKDWIETKHTTIKS